MIFTDSNVPMYVIGADHPNKRLAIEAISQHVMEEERLVTSVEVFQEILHRYSSLERRESIGPAFDLLSRIVDETFSIEPAHIERARELVVAEAFNARDALHVAVMESHGIRRILSFDRGFDRIESVERLS